ncbi:helix-turn-helix domain-containing protein [Pontibacter pudoricolor]|uniref:helix-turn-helix domain-containing protein n=1 Tax=Pontibacter pudoricolor TaxID=2694930 RepID=UPI001390F663|nr:helix-turn-helix transcriptional regulator [Pontibacter pudoricolor]
MSTIGQKISECRKAKGLTQEELAELSKVNLRTIQRIENNENTPRGSTLNMLCDVLQLETEELKKVEQPIKERKVGSLILNGIFLIVLNFAMMSAFGYLTLDTDANMNSRVGAYLLSVCMPLLVVAKTQHMDEAKRVLYYGGGFFVYMVFATLIIGFPKAFVSGLVPSLTIAVAFLYYGKRLLSFNSSIA